MEPGHRIFFETYGCSYNLAETETMAGVLSRQGHEQVKRIENADVVIVNSCSVKEATVKKILFRLRELREMYPEKRVVVTGCLSATERESIDSIGGVAVAGRLGKGMDIDEMLSGVDGKGKLLEPVCMPKMRTNEFIDIVPICRGCDSRCTFCVTKVARGDIYSFPQEKIISEIESMKKSGVKEFWITGQDVSAYGIDISGIPALPHLIDSITGAVGGKYFLRIGMLNPRHAMSMSNGLLKSYRSDNVFKFLHLPVQSGSDKVLGAMNRGYSASDFMEIVSKFRRHFPKITIWTDIIAGFPGETDDDFRMSVRLLEDTEPDFVNVSGFSSHKKAPASRMAQVPTHTRKERTRELSALSERLSLKKNAAWVGWQGEVLVDEYKKEHGNYIARNFAYKPIAIRSSDAIAGKLIKARVTGATPTCLLGEIIS